MRSFYKLDKNSKNDALLPPRTVIPHNIKTKIRIGIEIIKIPISAATIDAKIEPPTNKEVAVLEGGTFVTIVTLLWSSEISEGNFFTTFTLLCLRGGLLDFVFIGTQLLPSSLNCRPLAAAWAITDWRSWIEFFEGINDEILTPSNICLYSIT